MDIYDLKESCLVRTKRVTMEVCNHSCFRFAKRNQEGIKCATFGGSRPTEHCAALGGFKGAVSLYDFVTEVCSDAMPIANAL